MAIITAAARGIVIKGDRRLLVEYEGPVMPKKTWAQSLLQQMGFVKHQGTTKINVAVADFESEKETFLSDITATVVMEEIPPDLIINWDHTGLNLILSSPWTIEKKGSRQVELAGLTIIGRSLLSSVEDLLECSCLHKCFTRERQADAILPSTSPLTGT